MATTVFWGPDHLVLGEVASAAVGPRAGLAITRGRFAKTYSYLDPNEDMAAVIVGERSTVLVVADGHNGALAADTATREVLETFGEDPPPAVSEQEWPALFQRVNTKVLEAVFPPSPQPSSRTVLLVAVVCGQTVSWGSLGDAALVVAAPGAARGRQLNQEASRYVGYPMSGRVLDKLVQRGRHTLAAGEYVVLATDGLSEFVSPMRPADVIPRALARAGGPGAEQAARAIVDAAGEAGAGDNVATAVLAPL